ncbi:YncE family protein [Flavobacterium sp. GT3R68]|uniref:YncE family protein n=1 Tax=Flavobacterium sp. GT3R68 TaxID=2594437 RepID=UPI000F878156|nr:DUF5074 domain-containing protein [Flavobacterium sp. GT3R68]RTY87252.1 hypothetical protein EKL32_26630 [Flavobacterium sp. GSN2]TRW89402.1 hypothetical protein FNW07_12925 [Flavobacterium sp. GT3R68]
MNFKKVILVTLISTVFLVSCDNNDNVQDAPLGTYDNGALILNQGGFGNGNASVSYLSNDFATFQNTVFSVVNPTITLGDTAQDMGFYNNYAFIILNGSNKIEVVDRYSFETVATITTGLSNPRYIAFANGKGYVTNWGNGNDANDDFVAVINLTDYTVSSTISVLEGPEKIVEYNNKLYVAHYGGYGFGSTVSVINSATNTVSTSIPVGDLPNSVEINNGNLYVICGGKPSWSGAESAGKLVKVDLSNNTVTGTINFATASHPSNLEIENEAVYYTLDSGIFKTTLTATTLPATPLFTTTSQGAYGIYSFKVENNKIFVGDAGDYSANGKVYIYSLTGVLEHDYTVGVIPAGFYFND